PDPIGEVFVVGHGLRTSPMEEAEHVVHHVRRPEDALEERPDELPEPIRLLEEPEPRADDPQGVDRAGSGGTAVPAHRPTLPIRAGYGSRDPAVRISAP